jgi:ribosomal protein S18 acetylase RimI-like enzyme
MHWPWWVYYSWLLIYNDKWFNSSVDAYSNPDDATAELRRMAVSPNYRRQGIAVQLINAAVAHGRSQGIQSIYLTTSSYQPAAIKMYHKLGWELQSITEIPIRFEKIRVHKFQLDL